MWGGGGGGEPHQSLAEKNGSSYPGSSYPTGAVQTNPTSVCSISVCPNDGVHGCQRLVRPDITALVDWA